LKYFKMDLRAGDGERERVGSDRHAWTSPFITNIGASNAPHGNGDGNGNEQSPINPGRASGAMVE
jgi:hypothetical protein